MNEESHNPSIESELEARIVALVLGEASDFEREELNRIIEQRPELAAFRSQMQRVHGLLQDVGTGELAAPEDDWKLSTDRRNAVLAVIRGESPRRAGDVNPLIHHASPLVNQVNTAEIRGLTSPARLISQWNLSKLAAVVCIAGFIGIMTFWSFAPQERAASDYFYDVAKTDVSRDNFGTLGLSDGTRLSLAREPVSARADVEFFGRPAAGEVDQKKNSEVALSAIQDTLGVNAGLPSKGYQAGYGFSTFDAFNLKQMEDAAAEHSVSSSPESSLPSLLAENREQSLGETTLGIAMGDVASPLSGPKQEQTEEKLRQLDDASRGFSKDQLASPADGEKSDELGEQYAGRGLMLMDDVGSMGGEGIAKGERDSISRLDDSRLWKSLRAKASATEPEGESKTGEQWFNRQERSAAQKAEANAPSLDELMDLDAKLTKDGKSNAAGHDTEELGQKAKVDDMPGDMPGVGGSSTIDGIGVDFDFNIQETNRTLSSNSAIGSRELALPGKGAGGGGQVQNNPGSSRTQMLPPSVSSAAPPAASLLRQSATVNGGTDASKTWERRPSEPNDKQPELRFRYNAPSGMNDDDSRSTKKRAAPTVKASAGLNEKTAAEEAFSTFSLHVSDVSFKLAFSALARGEWPEAAKIRIEEFVNAFDYGDPLPSKGERVACRLEQSIHPFVQQRNLLRIAMRTAAAGRASNTPLRLTFLLDNSGSMERTDRQQTVRRAFALLAQQLTPIDQVTLISFARQPRLLAEKVSGADAGQLVRLIEELPSEGGTNIEAALQLAFEKAREQQSSDGQNRIILLTDGAVNLGDANPESLSQMVTSMRTTGIAFDAAGISADGLNDEVLEALTRKGDGRYYLLDSIESADDGFVRQIAGALRPSAKNVKVQIEFNPKRVGHYKLLGFEKHLLKKEDFRNDAVDAAEMTAAEAGVALYQFEAKADGEGDVGSVSVRFQDLSTGEMIENRWPIPYEADAPRPDQASPSLRIATSAALLAAKLRGEPLGETADLKTLSQLISGLPEQERNDTRVQQLHQMIEQARQLSEK
jgi:Mg-chelatase subunit ChlD